MHAEIAWICTNCGGNFTPGPTLWLCRVCGAAHPAIRGVPDLRTADDPYLANADDLEIARRLDGAFDRLDFRGLLDLYFDLAGEVTPSQRARQTAHILTAPARAGQWSRALGRLPAGPLLDLGCGSGSFLAEMGRESPAACGVDIAMRWLLVARKRLDEAALDRIALVCACAERLPLADGSLAGLVAGDVIEHVADQPATLAEAFRTLRPGGRAFFAAPNRFSLAPEPHVGVWGVGYLPRRLMSPYVRYASGLDFRAIRTLGVGEWKRLLRRSPFGGGRLTVPPLPDTDLADFPPRKRRVGELYNRVVGTGIGQWVGRAVGPLLHVVVERPNAAADQPSHSPTLQAANIARVSGVASANSPG